LEIILKVYIIRHDDSISYEYAAIAAESCDKVGLAWEYFEGFCKIYAYEAYQSIDIFKMDPSSKNKPAIDSSSNKASLCTASHVALWKKIAEEKETAIILEHDAIMLYKPELIIPDNVIVALGYKIQNPAAYNHVSVGAPRKISSINNFSGSHAYAITAKTAETLIDGIIKRKTVGCIDTHFFKSAKFRNGVNLAITDPICALGWLRKSTIWNVSSKCNTLFIDSFKQNYETN
jgi:hypothetical protein